MKNGNAIQQNKAKPQNPYDFLHILKQVIGLPYRKYQSRSMFNRPPYPIINENPSPSEIIHELKLVDAEVAGALSVFPYLMYFANTLTAHQSAKKYKTLWMVVNVSAMSGIGFILAQLPALRLKGMLDNGLRWKRQDGLEKFDTLTEFLEDHPSYNKILEPNPKKDK